MSEQRPLRIMQVVGGMNQLGIETWLMHVLRSIDRDRFQMDFVVDATDPGAYDDEVRALGSTIIPCAYPVHQPLRYLRNFRRILREHGPYDIIHCHERTYSYLLPLARWAGIPLRIAHSHNTDLLRPGWRGAVVQGYRALTRVMIARYATTWLACSNDAAIDRFGAGWQLTPEHRLLFCGIDLAPFDAAVDPAAVRAELGLRAEDFVIGHVGKFGEQKNHRFIVDIAAEVARREPQMRLLLIGDGVLRPEIAERVARAGLTDRVIFAGPRHDVPRLLPAMDLFLFPSLYEGLGMALVEAQAAGLPCLIADVVPREADVVGPLVRRASLRQPASDWAEMILAMRRMPERPAREAALTMVRYSQFNIETSRNALEQVYLAQPRRTADAQARAQHGKANTIRLP